MSTESATPTYTPPASGTLPLQVVVVTPEKAILDERPTW